MGNVDPATVRARRAGGDAARESIVSGDRRPRSSSTCGPGVGDAGDCENNGGRRLQRQCCPRGRGVANDPTIVIVAGRACGRLINCLDRGRRPLNSAACCQGVGDVPPALPVLHCGTIRTWGGRNIRIGGNRATRINESARRCDSKSKELI